MRIRFLALAVAALLLVPSAARGQLSFGAHGAWADEVEGGTPGLGGHVVLGFPLFPVDVVGAAEVFFPDCDDCSLWGGGVDARLTVLPLPLLKPYLLGGLVARSLDPGPEVESETDQGLAAGAGLQLSLVPVSVFLEARYEFVDAPDDQLVWRLGLTF